MTIIRSTPLKHPFARGHSALVQGGPGWVRGKASLDTETGALTMVLGLETDSTTDGVRGRMSVRVYDDAGVEIARVAMKHDMGIPGKAPGKARIEKFTMVRSLPVAVARRAARLDVAVRYSGKQFGLWGIPFEVVVKAIEIIFSGGDSQAA